MKLKKAIVWIFLISAVVAMTHSFAQNRNPLSFADVQNLLDGHVSQARIVSIVNQQGVSFQLTAPLRDKLQKSGAGAGLIDALAKASASISVLPSKNSVEQDPTAKETGAASSKSAKSPENRSPGSARGADVKPALPAKSHPAPIARSVKTNQQIDCTAI